MDLLQLVAMVRRRWLPILLCLIAGGAGGYYIGHSGATVYRAQSRTLLSVSTAHNVNQAIQGVVLTNNQIDTYASVATSRAVAERVVQSLGLTDTASSIAGRLGASVETNTSIIDITGTGPTPESAEQLADAAAIALGREIKALETRLPNQITARVLDVAQVPTTPVSPRPTLDLVVGLLLGALAGLATAALIEALDRTVKSTAQCDLLFNAPLLAMVPRRRGPTLVVGRDAGSTAGEPYRSLRTAVRFLNPDRPIQTLLITSAGTGDGKTTTAANLAVAIALSGERVVVMDADLRHAALASAFGLERSIGLTSLVVGSASLEDALQAWDEHLKVLASGPLPPNPSEIIGSQLFNHVLQAISDVADIVIIDAPPVLPVTDAVALAAQVDAVVLVARHGVTLRTAAAEARRRLEAVDATVVGYVLNAIPGREVRSTYTEYSYLAADRPQPGPPPLAAPPSSSDELPAGTPIGRLRVGRSDWGEDGN